MKEFIAVLEEGPKSWGAYVPDLPGCVAAGATRAEVVQLIQEAVAMHLEGLVEDGEPIPEGHYTGPGLPLKIPIMA